MGVLADDLKSLSLNEFLLDDDLPFSPACSCGSGGVCGARRRPRSWSSSMGGVLGADLPLLFDLDLDFLR